MIRNIATIKIINSQGKAVVNAPQHSHIVQKQLPIHSAIPDIQSQMQQQHSPEEQQHSSKISSQQPQSSGQRMQRQLQFLFA